MSMTTTAHDRYEHLKITREPFLRRAREAAEVTLPYLFPPEGATGDTDLPTPFQSVGARGTNSLAAKLLLALFPPNTSFFEIVVDDFAMMELAGESEEDKREIEAALASYVRAIEQQTEQTGVRNKAFEALKNLIVGGNALMQVLPDNRIRVHSLSRYVVKRDGEGNVIDIVVREVISRRTASPEILALVGPDPAQEGAQEGESVEDDIPVYTWVRRDPEAKTWKVHQEIGTEGTKLPQSNGTYPLKAPAFVPLRLIEVDGGDYGRGYAEEYLGDLISLEKNTQSIVEFSAAAARIIHMVKPGGMTDPDDVAEAASGDVIEGQESDISTLALDKFADFRITDAVTQRMERRLEQAFLLLTGVQRSGERVTAEEIRRLANELEQALGGVYSLLSEEFQTPLIQRVMLNMKKQNRLPDLPEGLVNFKVVTGLAAIGRNDEFVKLDIFAQGIQEFAGPEAVGDYLELGPFFQQRATALNLDIKIRSEEEVQKRVAARQQAAAQQAAAGPGMAAMGQIAKTVAEQPSDTGE